MSDTQLLRNAHMASLNQSPAVCYGLWQHVVRRGLLRKHQGIEVRNFDVLRRVVLDMKAGIGAPPDPVRREKWRVEAEFVWERWFAGESR